MSVALWTRRLPATTRAAVIAVGTRSEVGLVDRRSRLLALEEQGVGPAAPLEQDQVDPHADAAHPDDLADDVGLGEPVEQVAAILLEGRPVAGEEVVDQLGLLVVVDGGPDGGSSVMRGRPCAIVGRAWRRRPDGCACFFFSMCTDTRPRSAGSK